jgi:hypothetical protein
MASEEDAGASDLHRPSPKKRRPRAVTRALLFANSLAWLALVVTLMVLNGRGYIIASSFGCLFRTCQFDLLREPSHGGSRRQQLASIDRNVMNALQLVAKALEVWFLIIAGTLVYNISMAFARQRDGLPLYYLDFHEKFTGSGDFLRRSLWKAPLAREGERRRYSRKLYAVLGLVVLLCITSNLLGPAIAILLLPVRERTIVHHLRPRQFVQLHSEDPPSLALHDGEVTVDSQPATPVDRFYINRLVADSFDVGFIHMYGMGGLVRIQISTADWVNSNHAWIPCQKVLNQLSSQLSRYQNAMFVTWEEITEQQARGVDVGSSDAAFSDGESTTMTQSLYQTYRGSLDTHLKRRGPAIGVWGACIHGNTSVIEVREGMSVRCYTLPAIGQSYNFPLSDPDEGLSTRCIRVGPGWAGARNDHSRFFIQATDPPTKNLSGAASVDIYSVAGSIFLNSTTRHCRTPVSSRQSSESSCDWDRLFSEAPPSEYRNVSLNQQVVEYTYWKDLNTTNGDDFPSAPQPDGNSTHWCVSVASLGFGTYELGATERVLNYTGYTELSIDADAAPAEPLYIHPGWFLAGWDVDDLGTIYADWTNPAAFQTLHDVTPDPFRTPAMPSESFSLSFSHLSVLASSLSIITYDEILLNDTSEATDAAAGPVLESFVTAEDRIQKQSCRRCKELSLLRLLMPRV